MTNPRPQRVLILAPHTDDGEFGCGGTISKFIEKGFDVYYAAFSACQQSVLKEFPSDILITEVKAATEVLGIKKENLILFNYDVRTFNYRRQDILDDLIKLRTDINPNLIFIPLFSFFFSPLLPPFSSGALPSLETHHLSF